MIHTKKYKYLAFSIITALSLGIFTSCLALTNFNPNDFFIRNAKDVNLSTIKYIKGGETETGEIAYKDLYKVEPSDFKLIQDNYKGEMYPRYCFTFENNLEGSSMRRMEQPSYNIVSKFYANSCAGLVITNEEHLKNIFQVDTLEFVGKLDEPRNNGIYITDYFADSILFYNSGLMKNYKDVITFHSQKNHSRSVKAPNPINGIIKTNYKTKCEPLKKAYEDGKSIVDLSSKKEYVEILTYMLDTLATVYTFNPNFVQDDMTSSSHQAKSCKLVDKETEQTFKDFGTHTIFYCKELPSKTIMIPQVNLAANFGNITTQEIEKKLYERNYLFRVERSSFEYKLIDSTEFDVNIWITENHVDDFKTKLLTAQKNNICVSEGYYKLLKSKHTIQFGIDFDSDEIFKINQELNDNKLLCDNYLTKYSTSIGSYIIRFKDIFRIFYFFCMILSLIILIYYAVSTIRDNAYNIGVLKSLGYRGNELGVFYLFSFVTYSFITSIFFSGIYFLLSKLINEVLVALVMRGFKLKAIEGMPDVIAFDYRLFLAVTILLFIVNLLFAFIYLFKLRKNRIAQVIQNKE